MISRAASYLPRGGPTTTGAFTPSTIASARNSDEGDLRYILCHAFRVKDAEMKDHAVWTALKSAQIRGYRRDFISMPEKVLRDLTFYDTDMGRWYHLPKGYAENLVAVAAYVHHRSREMRRLLLPQEFDGDDFLNWRHNHHDPSKPIVKWNLPLSLVDDQLAQWMKSIKPSLKGVPVFSKPEHWRRWLRDFKRTVRSQNMYDTIDPNHVVTNRALDEARRAWMFNELRPLIKEPMSRHIMDKYADSNNTRGLIAELDDYNSKSQTMQLIAQQYSSLLTREKIEDFRGTQKGFITGHNNVGDKYNEIAMTPYNDEQRVQFLKNAVSGAPNLATVYETAMNARSTAGIRQSMTLSEYTAKLIAQAEIFDNRNKKSHPLKIPTERYSVAHEVNLHEYDQDDPYEIFMSQIGPIDESETQTPPQDVAEIGARIVAQAARNNSSKGMLPTDVYRSLPETARKAWTNMDMQARVDFVEALSKSKYSSPTTTNGTRTAKQHDVTPASDDAQKDSDEPQVSEREVTVHQRESNAHDTRSTKRMTGDILTSDIQHVDGQLSVNKANHDVTDTSMIQPPVSFFDTEVNSTESNSISGQIPKNVIQLETNGHNFVDPTFAHAEGYNREIHMAERYSSRRTPGYEDSQMYRNDGYSRVPSTVPQGAPRGVSNYQPSQMELAQMQNFPSASQRYTQDVPQDNSSMYAPYDPLLHAATPVMTFPQTESLSQFVRSEEMQRSFSRRQNQVPPNQSDQQDMEVSPGLQQDTYDSGLQDYNSMLADSNDSEDQRYSPFPVDEETGDTPSDTAHQEHVTDLNSRVTGNDVDTMMAVPQAVTSNADEDNGSPMTEESAGTRLQSNVPKLKKAQKVAFAEPNTQKPSSPGNRQQKGQRGQARTRKSNMPPPTTPGNHPPPTKRSGDQKPKQGNNSPRPQAKPTSQPVANTSPQSSPTTKPARAQTTVSAQTTPKVTTPQTASDDGDDNLVYVESSAISTPPTYFCEGPRGEPFVLVPAAQYKLLQYIDKSFGMLTQDELQCLNMIHHVLGRLPEKDELQMISEVRKNFGRGLDDYSMREYINIRRHLQGLDQNDIEAVKLFRHYKNKGITLDQSTIHTLLQIQSEMDIYSPEAFEIMTKADPNTLGLGRLDMGGIEHDVSTRLGMLTFGDFMAQAIAPYVREDGRVSTVQSPGTPESPDTLVDQLARSVIKAVEKINDGTVYTDETGDDTPKGPSPPLPKPTPSSSIPPKTEDSSKSSTTSSQKHKKPSLGKRLKNVLGHGFQGLGRGHGNIGTGGSPIDHPNYPTRPFDGEPTKDNQDTILWRGKQPEDLPSSPSNLTFDSSGISSASWDKVQSAVDTLRGKGCPEEFIRGAYQSSQGVEDWEDYMLRTLRSHSTYAARLPTTGDAVLPQPSNDNSPDSAISGPRPSNLLTKFPHQEQSDTQSQSRSHLKGNNDPGDETPNSQQGFA